ncbi:MAG: DUF4136 domain-containing protein [Eudoraea sp.]|uniref:DUF4136 domain-containing protein n=1 Tax=Eudoraea sp. TaxID=1979955 RepID=UPI003C75AABE
MKKIKIVAIPVLFILFLSSCASVSVLSDYDRQTDFKEYKSYAFYKTGIDRAQISDLDKKRILRAIETEMDSLGFVKSDKPDILVSIFTNERVEVDVYNGWGYGYGWGWGWGWPGYYNPYFWGPGYYGNNVSTRTEGSLYIDLIDTAKKELVWQGRGVGTLNTTKNIEKKEKRIRQFVSQILQQYPPEVIAAN